MNVALPENELPVRLRFDKPVTDEELLRFCERNELLRVERDGNGELIVMSPTGTDGGNVELDIATELNIWARQDGRGRALGSNSGVKLPDTGVRAADAGWVSWVRYNASPARGFRQIVPEFVIEVRSESDLLKPLQEKMQMWLANGAELAWLIDPSRKVVEIYRPAQKVEVQEGHSAVFGEGSVAGFVLELGKVWGEIVKSVRIDYTIYSPEYKPSRSSQGELQEGHGECWDAISMRNAKRLAKRFGAGSIILGNFNQNDVPLGRGEWTQADKCWVWDGDSFLKTYPSVRDRWIVVPEVWSRRAILSELLCKRD